MVPTMIQVKYKQYALLLGAMALVTAAVLAALLIFIIIPDTERLRDSAATLTRKADYPAAERMLRRALIADKLKFGSNSSVAAADYSQLGRLYRISGRLTDSAVMYNKAIAIYKKELPATHFRLAFTESAYADLISTTRAYNREHGLIAGTNTTRASQTH